MTHGVQGRGRRHHPAGPQHGRAGRLRVPEGRARPGRRRCAPASTSRRAAAAGAGALAERRSACCTARTTAPRAAWPSASPSAPWAGDDRWGIDVELTRRPAAAPLLFGEAQGRIVVVRRPMSPTGSSRGRAPACRLRVIGRVGPWDGRFVLRRPARRRVDLPVASLHEVWSTAIPRLMERRRRRRNDAGDGRGHCARI
jgi:hypothetical protein